MANPNERDLHPAWCTPRAAHTRCPSACPTTLDRCMVCAFSSANLSSSPPRVSPRVLSLTVRLTQPSPACSVAALTHGTCVHVPVRCSRTDAARRCRNLGYPERQVASWSVTHGPGRQAAACAKIAIGRYMAVESECVPNVRARRSRGTRPRPARSVASLVGVAGLARGSSHILAGSSLGLGSSCV